MEEFVLWQKDCSEMDKMYDRLAKATQQHPGFFLASSRKRKQTHFPLGAAYRNEVATETKI